MKTAEEMETLRKRPDWQAEYRRIIDDILQNCEFAQLADFHHHGTSLLEHCYTVSYLSYLLCRRLGLDFVAAARGGLLHDFFLYDWRAYKRARQGPNHGLHHPRVALQNACKHFTVSAKEREIILLHMLPKVWGWPRHPESWIVSLVDKYVALREHFGWKPHCSFLPGRNRDGQAQQ
ncbi:MAG: HD domain-containing protein [Bacillota bacterium]